MWGAYWRAQTVMKWSLMAGTHMPAAVLANCGEKATMLEAKLAR